MLALKYCVVFFCKFEIYIDTLPHCVLKSHSTDFIVLMTNCSCQSAFSIISVD